MSFKVDYLEEPELQFGDYFEHEDKKTGLREHGPFGKNIPGLHPSEIKLGFIGTRETISGAKEWIEECGSYIESENIKRIGSRSTHQTGELFDDDAIREHRYERIVKILGSCSEQVIRYNRVHGLSNQRLDGS